jgi:hypothetical protein
MFGQLRPLGIVVRGAAGVVVFVVLVPLLTVLEVVDVAALAIAAPPAPSAPVTTRVASSGLSVRMIPSPPLIDC